MNEMLQNAVSAPAVPVPSAPSTAEQPPGTVKRMLNFRDRLLIVNAARGFCRKDGKGSDHKITTKLDRVTKLLLFSDVIEYFEGVEDRLEESIWTWQKDKNRWMAYRNYVNGAITLQDLKNRIPDFDEKEPVPMRPSRTQPVSAPEDLRGPESSFFIPSKLDAWIQDVLKTASWDPMSAEFVTELCAKFGMKEDD